ncbi:unnamed protein product [Pleuronectes platessa]|uniref:Uncharacterized protein n=1 Tax=Pleuronectes platessa TaxID=8262 RepID=A0A9N7Z6Q6_PLEPL|nr:unnamed protein product [Pleuronectes platessa]
MRALQGTAFVMESFFSLAVSASHLLPVTALIRVGLCGSPTVVNRKRGGGESHWDHCIVITTRLKEAFVTRLDVFAKVSRRRGKRQVVGVAKDGTEQEMHRNLKSLDYKISNNYMRSSKWTPTSPSSSPSLSPFPGIPLLYHPQIRGLCGRSMDYDLWITHQRSQWWIQYGEFYIVQAYRSGIGGSCVALASDTGGGPGSRRRLMMDPNKRQWTMTVD